ncbi:MAG: hypothetical protein ACLFRQ_08410 [Desulfonatronovibrio sp.]
MEIQSDIGVVQMAQSMSKETFGAQVVTKTLDELNTNNNSSGSTDSDYDFQKSVLQAAVTGESTAIDKLV